ALRDSQAKLMKEKETLPAEEFQAKVKAFEASFKDKQAKFAKKREAFEKSAMEAHAKLRSKVVEAVGEISSEKKYKLVLSRQSVVIVEKSVDITSDAMAKLNDNVKSIPLK
ncbi:MAG: OmpH family outer membrane protein, partial [Bdellovibrionales bacterium]